MPDFQDIATQPKLDARLGSRVLMTRTVEELPGWVRIMLDQLSATDCCQSGKPRQYILRWDGRVLSVFDANENLNSEQLRNR